MRNTPAERELARYDVRPRERKPPLPELGKSALWLSSAGLDQLLQPQGDHNLGVSSSQKRWKLIAPICPGPFSVTQEWVTGRDHVRPSGNGMAFHAVNVRGGVPGRVFRVRPAQRNLISTRTSNLNLHSPPSGSDGGELSV